VCSFRCAGASPEIPKIFPKIPDFPETPEKSPEYPGFTDKFVLSGDFQDSPIHPPLGDTKILSSLYTRNGWVVVGSAGLVGHLDQFSFIVHHGSAAHDEVCFHLSLEYDFSTNFTTLLYALAVQI
jgi:hypothetical protein